MQNKKRAAVYCRVSTEDQAKEGLSVETQEKICTEAAEKDKYEVVAILKDEGRSGKDMNRPAMKELLKMVNDKSVEVIYTIHNDRIGRNTMDYLIFRELLRKQKITLNCIHQPMLSDDSATSRTMDTMMMSFNEMQRLITAEKVKGVMDEIAKAGYYPTAAPPGYLNKDNPDTSITIGRKIKVVDPVMGPLITELFQTYARGDMNVYELEELMYEKGLRNVYGNRIKANRIYDLLRNRFYLGEVHWGDVHNKNGKHEPLIDEETFNIVNNVLEEKNRRACRRRKYTWLLAGLVVCPTHNRRYAAEWHLDKTIAYYHCPVAGCRRYIEITELESMVAEKFRELEFSEEFKKLVMEKVREIFYERRKKYDSRRKGIVNRKTALEMKLKRAEEKLFADVISDDDFKRIRKETKNQLENVDESLYELEKEKEVNVDVAKEVLALTKDIYKTYSEASPQLKRQYLTFFWDYFEVKDGVILKSVSAPIFEALLEYEAVVMKDTEHSKRQKNAENGGFILRNVMSAH